MLRLIPAPLHRLLYRIAHAARLRVFRITRPHLRSVTVIGVTIDEQMLLIRTSYGPAGWGFPGGGIGRNETPDAAAIRELREETQCRITNLRCIEVIDKPVLGTTSTGHLYTGTVLDMPEADGREIVEARLFPLHSLPHPLTPAAARFLAVWRAQVRAND